jgi:phage/plasmid-associated DNA primase
LAQRLWKEETFTHEPTIAQVREEWAERADIIFAFSRQELVSDPLGSVDKNELYNKFCQWCLQRNYTSKSARKFNERLQQVMLGIEAGEDHVGGKHRHIWKGIGYRSEQRLKIKYTGSWIAKV